MQVVFCECFACACALNVILNISVFGETLNGVVVLENSENIKIRGRFLQATLN